MEKFANSLLRFECDIPDGWVLLPDPWAKKLKLSASPTSDKVAELLKENADAPFLSMYLSQHDPAESIPMVQGTVKPMSIINQIGGLSGVIDSALDQMEKAYPDFQLMQRADTYLVAGVVGAYMKASMSVLNENKQKFSCISEVILLKTARYCFILGFSGPADPAKRPVEDFNTIVRSIRVA